LNRAIYLCKVSKSGELFAELVPVVGLWWEKKKKLPRISQLSAHAKYQE